MYISGERKALDTLTLGLVTSKRWRNGDVSISISCVRRCRSYIGTCDVLGDVNIRNCWNVIRCL